MQKLYIKEAIKLAEKSLVNIASHGAIIIYRGKIIGKGFNKMCVPNINKINTYSVHAEVDAINDALRKTSKENLRKSTLIVVRVNNRGEILRSDPCQNCRNYISHHGIKIAYYS